MAQLPGGLGSQQFGVGPFVAPRLETDVGPVVYLATAEGENVVRQERVVYSPSSTPVFVAPTVTPSALAEVAANIVRRTVVRSLAVFAATSAMAEPVFVPAQVRTAVIASSDIAPRARRIRLPDGYAEAISPPAAPATPFTGTIASAHSSATVIFSRVVYDQVAVRPVFPPAPPPTVSGFVPDGPQNWFRRPRIKQVPLSAFVFAYPIDDLPADYTQQFVPPKRKVLPSGLAEPPFNTTSVAPPSIDSKLAGAYSSATVVLSRVVYDSTSTPVFKPVVAVPAPTFYQAEEGAPRRRVSRPGIKLILEGIERPWPPVPAVTPSYLFETIPPPWTAKPNRVAIKSNLDGVERPLAEPAPPASTPAILFDVIPAVQAHLPNRAAITINLQGFAWNPQDPANLTGTVTVPDTGPGGACRPEPKGPQPPYYRELREKDFYPKFRRQKKYEELLEELQAKADVPAVVVEAVSVLAGKTEAPQIETRADLAALAALVQAYRVNQRATEQAIAQSNAQAAADAEMIAVVLALEEEEMKQIVAIAMLLASED